MICGGPGFKIYSQGDSWLILKGNKKHYVKPNQSIGDIIFENYSAIHKLIVSYINLKYQPRDRQADIKDRFDTYLKTL